MIMFKCKQCGDEKELNSENFYKATKNKNGFSGKCKVCTQRDQEITRRKKGIKKRFYKKKNYEACNVGQKVLYNGVVVSVCEIMGESEDGRKEYIACNPIDSLTGKALRRTTITAGTNWEYIK